MAELEWQGAIPAGSLRRALRHALRRSFPGWRVVAEGFLGAVTPIDLLAVGANGELICIRAATGEGQDGGARLLASALSDRAWIAPRISDLHKLAPELGLRPLAPPRIELFAPDFDTEVRTAAEHLSALLGRDRLGLTRYQALRQQGQLTLLLDPLVRDASRRSAPPSGLPSQRDLQAAPLAPSPPLVDPPSPSAFRTGLVDADLRAEPVAPA